VELLVAKLRRHRRSAARAGRPAAGAWPLANRPGAWAGRARRDATVAATGAQPQNETQPGAGEASETPRNRLVRAWRWMQARGDDMDTGPLTLISGNQRAGILVASVCIEGGLWGTAKGRRRVATGRVKNYGDTCGRLAVRSTIFQRRRWFAF